MPVRRRVKMAPGNKKGAIRDTEVVYKLAVWLEAEHSRYGTTDTRGARLLSIRYVSRQVASILGVSIGTLQNCYRALKLYGFILSQHESYVRLRPKELTAKDKLELRELSPDPGYEPGKAVAAETDNRHRLSESEVRHLYTDLLRNDGREAAGAALDWHRTWCQLNGFKPYL